MDQAKLSTNELHEAWPLLSLEERVDGFSLLSPGEAEEQFNTLDAREQAELLLALPNSERRLWLRVLAPDDAADVIQEADLEQRHILLALLDPTKLKEVSALLAYAEDAAGGLMNPRYARLRPDMTVDQAIAYLRRQRSEHIETIYYAYVLDGGQRLLGVVSLRQLFAATPATVVNDVMRTDTISVREETDQEDLSNIFAEHDLLAVPVVDNDGVMKGIVTIDDIVDVVQEEATEDMHKIGGTEALDAPYLQVALREMLTKRAGWLAALVVLGFLTVMAMQRYEEHLHTAGILAIFVPLIISSGGNSGAQAATLVVRAMALDEVRPRDWWRVIRRELAVGVSLGAILGTIGLLIVFAWNLIGTKLTGDAPFGEHVALLALTISSSIVCVALWGTIAGSMLPFGLRVCGFDPASASAPLVATLVDASGLIIYFTIAEAVLSGTLL